MTEETALKKSVIAYCLAKGCFVWGNATGQAKHQKGDAEYHVPYGKVGSSDVIGVLPDGRFLAIEIKVGKNTPTHKQWEFMLTIQRLGGVAFWTNDMDEFIRCFEEILKGRWIAVSNGQQFYTNHFRTSEDEPNPVPPPLPKNAKFLLPRTGWK